MSTIGAITASGIAPHAATRLPALDLKGLNRGGAADKAATGPSDFAGVLSQLASPLIDKQNEAAALTKSVLLGQGAPLHQSVIAMQEASVAFSLMVEVRNKVVEGFQELMRMPV
jgi:flagellar hook-basal body complex protein FliE